MRVPFRSNVVLLAFVPAVAACSSSVHPHPLLVAPETAPAAEVSFYRTSAIRGVLVRATVAMDGEPLITLKNGTWGRVYVEPGSHVFRVSWGADTREGTAFLIQNRSYHIDIASFRQLSPERADTLRGDLGSIGGAASPDRFPSRLDPGAPLRERVEWILADLEGQEEIGSSGLTLSDPDAALADWLERGGPGLTPRHADTDVEELLEELRVAAGDRPDDVALTLLYVRLGRAHAVAHPVAWTRAGDEWVREGEDPHPPLHAALERALEIEPENPELHYWQARLYGLTTFAVVDGRVQYPMRDATAAVASARRAVELTPESAVYREALGQYLLATNQHEEAMAVLRQIAGGMHPLYRILSEWDRIPVPPNAIFSAADTRSFLDQSGVPGQYRGYRVRFFVVPGPAADLAAYYAERISDFAWHEMRRSDDDEAPRMRLLAQFLTRDDEGLHSTADKDDIPDSYQANGIMITLMEVSGVDPSERRTTPAGSALPIDPGDIYCYLIIGNLTAYGP